MFVMLDSGNFLRGMYFKGYAHLCVAGHSDSDTSDKRKKISHFNKLSFPN